MDGRRRACGGEKRNAGKKSKIVPHESREDLRLHEPAANAEKQGVHQHERAEEGIQSDGKYSDEDLIRDREDWQ